MAFYNPPVNFASPPPLGTTTPNTVAGTTGAFSGAISSQGQALGTIRQDNYQIGAANSNIDSTGVLAGVGWGLRFYDGANFYNSTLDAQVYRVSVGRVKVGDGASGFGFLQAKITTDTAATTGLIAGALAALTTGRMLWYDANGVGYYVPVLAA